MENGKDPSIISQMLHDLEQADTMDISASDNSAAEPGDVDGKAMDDVLEAGQAFDFDGYQVVRREFFAHTFEPSISFNNYKMYVNTACLNKFPHADFVQILVNRDRHILAIRPCEEMERDAFAWCGKSGGKRKPKQITCKLFFAKIFELMGWNLDYRYKLLGKVIHANGQFLIAFDMSATEVYQRTVKDGAKPKSSRTPVFPAGWKDQFGLPYYEHQKSLQVNIFDGYAVYGIKDNTVSSVGTSAENTSQEVRQNSSEPV